MAKLIFVVLAAALLAVASAKIAFPARGGGCQPSTSFDWDYFLLMQQWPGAECNITHCLPNANKYNYWTLHGLWPQRNDNTWPQCCPGPRYDPSRLADLQGLLTQWWPSFEHGSDPNGFWSHEWEKHGTCAGTDHSCCGSEHDYFASALALVKQVNIEAAFDAAGIKWSAWHPTDTIMSVLVKAYGVKPLIGCSRSQLLHTMGFCFDKNLQAFDCPQSHEACTAREVYIPPPPNVRQ